MKTIDKLTEKDFFYCYDLNLSNFLKKNNVRYILKARSVKDSAIFTVYLHTDRLHNVMREYNNLIKKDTD